MKRGETTASARRVGPLLAIDSSNVAQTAKTFATAGDLQVRVDGGAFGTALGSIVEFGGSGNGQGYYYYQPDPTEITGYSTSVKIGGTSCQEFTVTEPIEYMPQGITVGETSSSARRILGLAAFSAGGVAVTAASCTVQVSINGGAWATAGGTLTGNTGYPYYDPTDAEVATKGWLAIKLSGVGVSEHTIRVDVIDPTPTDGTATVTAVSPEPDTHPGESSGFPGDYRIAKSTPIVLTVADSAGLAFVSVTAMFLDGTVEEVYRGSSFAAGYTEGSSKATTSTVVTSSTAIRLTIRRDEHWPQAESTAYPLAVGLVVDAINNRGGHSTETFYWQMPSPRVVGG